MAGDEQIGQDEIEELLRQAQSGAAPAAPTPPQAKAEESSLGQDEIEALLREHPVPQTACEALVQLALERGGTDNITVLLSRYTILAARKQP